MKKIFFLIGMMIVSTAWAEEVVFTGIPITKISENGADRVVEEIKGKKAVELRVVIVEKDGKFFWESRESIELAKTSSGAFATFIALNGSGYIRVLLPEHKAVAALIGGAEKNYDYVEHLLIGLRSVTYYGEIAEA